MVREDVDMQGLEAVHVPERYVLAARDHFQDMATQLSRMLVGSLDWRYLNLQRGRNLLWPNFPDGFRYC